MTDRRKRYQFRFWLDGEQDDDAALVDAIGHLKGGRKLTATIRQGLQLVLDLRAGRVDCLLRWFPWVAEAVAPAPAPGDGEVLREIARLRDLILAQQAAPAFPPPPRDTPALRPLTALDEEGDVVLTVTATKATNSAANFIGSLLALQQ